MQIGEWRRRSIEVTERDFRNFNEFGDFNVFKQMNESVELERDCDQDHKKKN